ncbi:MAG: ribbon-helix-helix domain-containing protein [Rhodopila sp.]
MARRPSPPSLTDAKPLPAATFPTQDSAAPVRNSAKPPSRQEKKGIAFYVSRECWLQLGITSKEMDRPIQRIMEEALDDWFRKYGKHPLASRVKDAA